MSSDQNIETLREMYEQAKSEVEASAAHKRMIALGAAIAKMEAAPTAIGAAVAAGSPKRTIEGLAAGFVRRAGEPKPIREVFDYINSVRHFPDPKKARINVVSALSKGSLLKSVQWKDEHAWWFKNEPLPKQSVTNAP